MNALPLDLANKITVAYYEIQIYFIGSIGLYIFRTG